MTTSTTTTTNTTYDHSNVVVMFRSCACATIDCDADALAYLQSIADLGAVPSFRFDLIDVARPVIAAQFTSDLDAYKVSGHMFCRFRRASNRC